MATKVPSVTRRIEMIEAAMAKLQGQLEDAEGERKAALGNLIDKMHATLERLKRHTLH